MEAAVTEAPTGQKEKVWIVWAGVSDNSSFPDTLARDLHATKEVRIFDISGEHQQLNFQARSMFYYWIDLLNAFSEYTKSPGVDSPALETLVQTVVENPISLLERYERYAQFSKSSCPTVPAELLPNLKSHYEESKLLSVRVSSSNSQNYDDLGVALLADDSSDPGRVFRDVLEKFCKDRDETVSAPGDLVPMEDDSSQIPPVQVSDLDAKQQEFVDDKCDSEADNEQEHEICRKIYYYDNQVVMGENLLKRIQEMYRSYHGVNDLLERFDDVDFRIYTPRFNMLQNQTMNRVCDLDAGVLPSIITGAKERLQCAKNRVRKYRYSEDDRAEHSKLKIEVQNKPKTLFVIVADECHWGITQGEDKAHNRLINDWNHVDHKNVIVLQVSATPYNLLTVNSRLPVATYSPPPLGPAANLTSESLVCGSQELHLAHWSEVDMARLQKGATFKLKTCLSGQSEDNCGLFWIQLAIDSSGSYLKTCPEEEATLFSTEGLGKGFTAIYATTRQGRRMQLYVEKPETRRASPRILAYNQGLKHDNQSIFELVLDFGVGLAAIRSCNDVRLYLTVPKRGGPIIVDTADITTKGLTKLMPKKHVFQLEQLLCVKSFRQHNKTKSYLSLNYYFNTMNQDGESKIREDCYFQQLCADNKDIDSDSLLAADYAYNMILVASAVACMDSASDSPVGKHREHLKELIHTLLKALGGEKAGCAIDKSAFLSATRHMTKKVVTDMKRSLVSFRKANRAHATPFSFDQDRELEKDFAGSLAAVFLHLTTTEESSAFSSERGYDRAVKLFLESQRGQDWFKQYWHSIMKESETAQVMLDLVQSSRVGATGQLRGKMKILRVHREQHGKQFCRTMEIALATVQKLPELGVVSRFAILRDFGGEKLEPQVRKCSSLYEQLQRRRCEQELNDNLERCPCTSYQRSKPSGRVRASFICKCGHLHHVVDQYESLEDLPCILILVEKGRMGDTFPHSFNCLDLRLMHSSGSFRLSTLVQELGRLCRYVDDRDKVVPYVLLGKCLFGKLEMHQHECSLFSLGVEPDAYMTKYRGLRPDLKRTGSLRWTTYRATDDSYDTENTLQHKNRLLLQAEPQIGKTGAYLYLIQRLRKLICKQERELNSVVEYFEYETPDAMLPSEQSNAFDASEWVFPYWKNIDEMGSITDRPVHPGKYNVYDRTKPRSELIKKILNRFIPSGGDLTSAHPDDMLDLTATGSTSHKQSSTGGEQLKAHCYSHIQTCAECAREEGNLADPHPVFTSEISGIGNFRLSIPATKVFQDLHKRLGHGNFQQKGKQLEWGELNNALKPGLRHWIIHPSYNRARKAMLNYNHVMEQTHGNFSYIQVVVVRKCDFNAYIHYWGKTHMIVELPDSLKLPDSIQDLANFPSGKSFVDKGGIGYCRLFIQLFAAALKLDNVFVFDDNVRFIKEIEGERSAQTPVNGPGEENWKLISFSECLSHIERQTCETSSIPIEVQKTDFEEHERYKEGLFSYSGPFNSYAALGFQKRPVSSTPFLRTQVYSAILLNVRETTEKGLFYRPLPCCEDLMFNDECDEKGLWLCKYCRFVIGKAHFKDWMLGFSVFRWNERTVLKLPVAADDIRVQDEPQKLTDFIKYLTKDSMVAVKPFYPSLEEALTERYGSICRDPQPLPTDDVANKDKPLVIPWFVKIRPNKHCDRRYLVELFEEELLYFKPSNKIQVPSIALFPAKLLCDNQLATTEDIRSFITDKAGFGNGSIQLASVQDPETSPIAVVLAWNSATSMSPTCETVGPSSLVQEQLCSTDAGTVAARRSSSVEPNSITMDVDEMQQELLSHFNCSEDDERASEEGDVTFDRTYSTIEFSGDEENISIDAQRLSDASSATGSQLPVQQATLAQNEGHHLINLITRAVESWRDSADIGATEKKQKYIEDPNLSDVREYIESNKQALNTRQSDSSLTPLYNALSFAVTVGGKASRVTVRTLLNYASGQSLECYKHRPSLLMCCITAEKPDAEVASCLISSSKLGDLLIDEEEIDKPTSGKTVMHLAIERRWKRIVEQIATNYPAAVGARDAHNRTPLEYAKRLRGSETSKRPTLDKIIEILEGAEREKGSPLIGKSRKRRSSSKDRTPSKKPRPSSKDSTPSKKPRPSSKDSTPSKKSRPSSKDSTPSMKARPSSKDSTPSKKPRPSSKDSTPSMKARPSSKDSTPSKKPRLCQLRLDFRQVEGKKLLEMVGQSETEKKVDVLKMELGTDKPSPQPTHRQMDVYWRGGTLGLMSVERKPRSAVSSFRSVIGSSGGKCGAGGISLRVPAGVVSAPMEFSGEIFLDSFMPPTGSNKEDFVLSPVVYLSPSETDFKGDIQLTLPAFEPFTSKQHGSGWLMELRMRASSHNGKAEPWTWNTSLTLNTATGEVTTRSPDVSFNPHPGIIQLRHFCGLCWLGHLGIKSLVERTVSYAVFGKQLKQRKWIIYGHIVHGTGTQVVYEELVRTMREQSYVLLHPAKTGSIGRRGDVELTVECTAPWKLCNGPGDARIPTRLIWNSPVNGATYFAVTIEDPTEQSEVLKCTVTASSNGDEPIPLVVAHSLSSGPPSGTSSAAVQNYYNTTFMHSIGLAFGPNAQIAMAPAHYPDVDTQKAFGLPAESWCPGIHHDTPCVRNSVINPDHVQVGVTKQLCISIPRETDCVIPPEGCFVQFISYEDGKGKIIEVAGDRRNDREVEVLFPAWPFAVQVFVRIVSTKSKQQLALGFLNVEGFAY